MTDDEFIRLVTWHLGKIDSVGQTVVFDAEVLASLVKLGCLYEPFYDGWVVRKSKYKYQ